jgi:hypothetical protein
MMIFDVCSSNAIAAAQDFELKNSCEHCGVGAGHCFWRFSGTHRRACQRVIMSVAVHFSFAFVLYRGEVL